MTDPATTHWVYTENQGLSGSPLTRPSCLPLNPGESEIFQERAAALIGTFQRSPTPRYLVADSKLYTEDNATNLRALGFITRLPNTLKLVSQVIMQALRGDMWQRFDDTTRYHQVELCHYRMAQRWLVVSSQAACDRAEASV